MKKHLLKSLLALALVLITGNAWGEEIKDKVYTFGSSVPSGWTVSAATTAASGYLKMKSGETIETSSITTLIPDGNVLSSSVKLNVSCGTFGSWNNTKQVTVTAALLDDAGTVLTSANYTKSSLGNSENTYMGNDYPIEVQKPNDATKVAKLKITFTIPGSSDVLRVKNVKLTYSYEKDGVPAKTLQSLAISGTPTKTTYEVGGSFEPTGLVVTGTYSDSSTADLTEDAEWTITPATFTATTETSVSVTAMVGTISSATFNVTGLTVNEHVITPGTYDIVPNNSFYGTTNTYSGPSSSNPASLTGKQNDIEIIYSKGSQQNFYVNGTQTRTYSGSTMTFSVPAGYAITAIAFTADGSNWDGTHTASAGSMTDSKNWAGEAQEVTITFGGTCRITSISVTFIVSSKTLTSVAVSGTPTKTSYTEGDEFDPAGLVVTGTYDDATTDDALASQATWSCTPETLTAGATSVTVTATVNGITSEAYVVNGITVEPFVQTYANTYTSNVVLSEDNGTSASKVKVKIGETTYDAIKAGTGSVQGVCEVAIPAGTKTLHFHAAGWNGESVELKVNGAEYTLTSDTGVSGNSPFILANDPETNDYFTFSPNGATTITFTATLGNRFVLFGVNAELYKSHNATIASSGKSTLYLDYAVIVPEGVKAYYATGYDSTNDIVTMTEVTDNTIAKNQGVMLMGEAGETYTFEETADVDAPTMNYFGGSVTGMNMNDKTGEEGYYILQGGQFAPISDGDLPAYKAYLYLEGRPYTGQGSTIGFRFGDATQIENMNAVEAGKYYDLMGREVLNPAGGIYILNGKKVLVK